LQRKLHQTIKRVSDDFQARWHFNTSIAAIMELMNQLYGMQAEIEAGQVPSWLLAEALHNLLLMLAPFAPYLAHELWGALGQDTSALLRHRWPKYDPALAKEEEIDMAVQINGKLRGRLLVAADAAEDSVRKAALADEKIVAAIAGKQVAKVIVVPGRLVNIVVRQ
jgi:leucyl-tRNA synthetase